jgi:photosystem II stability/assembly factor-like uncharacterized protein
MLGEQPDSFYWGCPMRKINLFYCSLFFCFFCGAILGQEINWEKSKGVGGEPIKAIAVDSKGFVYAAGTVFVSYSEDEGKSWARIKGSSTSNDIYITNKGTILLGTEYGIMRTTNGGNVWTNPTDIQYSVIGFAFKSPNIIYAVTNSHGLYFSTNDGINWSQISSDILPWELSCVFVDSSGTIFAGTFSTDGIFRSKDGGVTWENVLSGLAPVKMAQLPNGNLLALIHYLEQTGMLIESSDGGNSWESILPGFYITFAVNSSGDIFVSTYSDYTSVGHLLRSTDAGLTWNNTNWYNTRITDIDVYQNILYASYSQGVGTTSDWGDHWFYDNAESGTSSVNAIVYDNDGNLYAAAGNYFFDDSGIYKSIDDGKTWNRIFLILSSTVANGLIYLNNGEMFYGSSTYSGTINGGIFKSIDGGYNWQRIVTDEVYKLIKNQDGSFYACAANGLYMYDQNDDSLINIYANSTVWAAVSLPGNQILAGVSVENGIIIKGEYVNGTWQWDKTSAGSFINSDVTALALNSNGDIIAGTANEGIFYSTDNGINWKPSSLNTYDITKLLILNNGVILAGTTSGGLFKSSDNGKNWNDFSLGLFSDPDYPYPSSISSLTLKQDGKVYAGTLRSGLYVSSNPLITIINSPKISNRNFILFQNYPNPFNPTTTINYSVPKASFVRIKVYDLLGREVETLVNGEKPAGNYSVQFNGSNLASGIYFYRMQAGDFVQTKKTILLK